MKKYHKQKTNPPTISDGKVFRLVIFCITILLLLLIWSQHGRLSKLSKYGYLGLFIINFISSATVLVPFPGTASVFLGGAIWNPYLVGLISGIGASIGELFGYFVGYGGRGLTSQFEKNPWFAKVEQYFHKAGFMTTLVFSLLPLPIFDFIGVLAGALNYPIWKFTLATLIGRIIRNIFIAWSGAKIIP